jgi:hypothetical protein
MASRNPLFRSEIGMIINHDHVPTTLSGGMGVAPYLGASYIHLDSNHNNKPKWDIDNKAIDAVFSNEVRNKNYNQVYLMQYICRAIPQGYPTTAKECALFLLAMNEIQVRFAFTTDTDTAQVLACYSLVLREYNIPHVPPTASDHNSEEAYSHTALVTKIREALVSITKIPDAVIGIVTSYFKPSVIGINDGNERLMAIPEHGSFHRRNVKEAWMKYGGHLIRIHQFMDVYDTFGYRTHTIGQVSLLEVVDFATNTVSRKCRLDVGNEIPLFLPSGNGGGGKHVIIVRDENGTDIQVSELVDRNARLLRLTLPETQGCNPRLSIVHDSKLYCFGNDALGNAVCIDYDLKTVKKIPQKPSVMMTCKIISLGKKYGILFVEDPNMNSQLVANVYNPESKEYTPVDICLPIAPRRDLFHFVESTGELHYVETDGGLMYHYKSHCDDIVVRRVAKWQLVAVYTSKFLLTVYEHMN